MNFRIPLELKTQFHAICRKNRIPMTAELVRLVNAHVFQNAPAAPRQQQPTISSAKPRTITYRDPDTWLLVTREI